jgi:hypothetical protein
MFARSEKAGSEGRKVEMMVHWPDDLEIHILDTHALVDLSNIIV